MSERRPTSRRRRRRRNRPVVIEEGGPDGPTTADPGEGDPGGGDAAAEDADAAASARGGGGGGRTDRRRGARVQKDGARPNTILGMPRFMFFMMAALLVAVGGTTIAGQLVGPSDQIAGVVEYPDQGRRHLADGESFAAYNSFPPTSGPQAASGVAPGIYGPGAAPSFAQLLPILEQGGVVVYYDPARLSAADAETLRGFVQVRSNSGWDLLTLVELDASLPSPIVATAWRHALSLETLDEDALELLTVFVDPDPDGLYQRFVLEQAPPAVDES